MKRGNTLKRLIMIGLALLLLTACGREIHENISEEMVEDTEQIISIFDETIKEDRELSNKEVKTFERYKIKYETKKENPEVYPEGFSEEEIRLYGLTDVMIDDYDRIVTLSSDHEDYETQRDRLYRVIETGKIDK